MKLDSCFRSAIGKEICQDYSLHGESPFPFIIVSDGCSSSEQVDVGARILCHSAHKYLTSDIFEPDKFNGEEVINYAKTISQDMGLSDYALDATLLIAYCINGVIRVFMFGDGYVIVKKKEDIGPYTWATTRHYYGNAPYYLNYLTSPERKALYKDSLKHETGDELSITETIRYSEDESGVNRPEPKISTVVYDVPFSCGLLSDEVDFVMLASDGISSFFGPKNFHVPDFMIINDICSFKNSTGSFVKRRTTRMLEEWKKTMTFNYDDVAFAIMKME
jgi:hypothetical protein